MTSKELFYFTGQCLALDDHPEFRKEIIHQIHAGAINWERFVSLCSNHLIMPAIYLKFREHALIEHIPLELAEFLKEVYRLNQSRNKQIIKQLKDITRVLNEHKIHPTYLKGTAHLLDTLYNDIGERMIGDIDLLVSEADFLPAISLLKNEGYETMHPVLVNMETLKHYPGLSKAGAITHIEVHRLPVSRPYDKWFNTSLIDTEKKTVSALEGCYVLSDSHLLIHNFMHCQLGHKGHLDGIVSFRDLYDVYLLSKRMEIKHVLPDIHFKRKAIAYFAFANKALGLKEKVYPTTNLTSLLFILKHDLNISSKLFYQIHRYIVYFSQRLFMGYIRQFIQCFYSRDTRKSVISRLSNPQWYKAHLHSYTSFFTGQG